MKKILIAALLMLGLAGTVPTPAQAQAGRHFVLQGNDAVIPIGINETDTLELGDYHGNWSRFSNLGEFVLNSDTHIDYRDLRENRNLTVNNTKRFVNNGKISLHGKAIKMGDLASISGEPVQPILDIQGGVMLFDGVTYEGNGGFELPVVEMLDQAGRPIGESAVGGKLLFEGGVISAPVYISLERYGAELPLAPSELVLMRDCRLGNALTPDLAVVLQTRTLGNISLILVREEIPGKGEAVSYLWKVEPVR